MKPKTFVRTADRIGYEDDPRWRKGHKFTSTDYCFMEPFPYAAEEEDSTRISHSMEVLEEVESSVEEVESSNENPVDVVLYIPGTSYCKMLYDVSSLYSDEVVRAIEEFSETWDHSYNDILASVLGETAQVSLNIKKVNKIG